MFSLDELHHMCDAHGRISFSDLRGVLEKLDSVEDHTIDALFAALGQHTQGGNYSIAIQDVELCLTQFEKSRKLSEVDDGNAAAEDTEEDDTDDPMLSSTVWPSRILQKQVSLKQGCFPSAFCMTSLLLLSILVRLQDLEPCLWLQINLRVEPVSKLTKNDIRKHQNSFRKCQRIHWRRHPLMATHMPN